MSYSSVVLADTPVAYWRLNETSGTSAADATGNGHTGTYTGTFTLNQTGPPIGDPTGKSVLFDGSTAYVQFANIDLLTAWSIEGWIKTNGNQPQAAPIMSADGTGGGTPKCNYILGFTDQNSFNGDHNTGLAMRAGQDAGGWSTSPGATLSDTVWHHVVGSVVGGLANQHIRIYLDSVLSDSAPGVFTLQSDSYAGLIGRATTALHSTDLPNVFFNGNLAEVALYNYQLSTAQVQAHFAATSAPQLDMVV